MSGRKHDPYERENVWFDSWTEDRTNGFEDDAVIRMDLHRLIVALPTQQRIAVQKWMRDESLTAAERMSLTRAKRSLAQALQNG